MNRKIFTLSAMLCMVMSLHAQTSYELSEATFVSDVNVDGAHTWNFSNGVTIQCGKDWATGSKITVGTIKFSRNHNFTVNIPEGVSVTGVRVVGWSNIAESSTDPLATVKINGVDDTNTLPYNTVTTPGDFTIDYSSEPLTGSFILRFNGSQACAKLYLLTDEGGGGDEPVVEKKVILSYTVDGNSTSGEDLDATSGKIFFGASKFETSTVTSTGYAYKSDGDVGETSTKYILLKPSRPLAVGDIIEIEAYASSTPKGNDYGFSLYDERGASAPLTTLYLTAAKNTLQTLTYTVTEGDGFEGLEEIWVFRATGKSTYFYSSLIYGEEETEDFTITIGQYGMVTFYDSQVSYTIPEGLTASVVESVSDKSINLLPLEGGVIPANCGVVLEGTAGETYTLVPTTEESPVVENLLRGSDEKAYTVGDDPDAVYKFYALSTYNGIVAFCWMANYGEAFENEAHKAYLPIKQENAVPGSNAYYFDTPDGMEDIQVRTSETNAPVYNLSGQRVDGSYKGVVITNGVKAINK